MEKKRKKKNWILNIILIIAVLCFVGSGGYLLKYYWDGWQKEKDMGRLHDLILTDEELSGVSESTGTAGADDQADKSRRHRTGMPAFWRKIRILSAGSRSRIPPSAIRSCILPRIRNFTFTGILSGNMSTAAFLLWMETVLWTREAPM